MSKSIHTDFHEGNFLSFPQTDFFCFLFFLWERGELEALARDGDGDGDGDRGDMDVY